MKIRELISEEYQKQNAKIHRQKNWGCDGRKCAKIMRAAIKILGIKSLLDYGCGQGTLKTTLRADGCGIDIFEYDPAIPGKDKPPGEGADMVVCTDVLEHIEPQYIDKVMAHIWMLAGRYAYFVIATKPARQVLPDGRNAHLIVEDWGWWRDKIKIHGWVIMGAEEKNDSRGKIKEIRVWLRKR